MYVVLPYIYALGVHLERTIKLLAIGISTGYEPSHPYHLNSHHLSYNLFHDLEQASRTLNLVNVATAAKIVLNLNIIMSHLNDIMMTSSTLSTCGCPSYPSW